MGIKDNLVRFSCGIESAEDIWADFVQAFEKICVLLAYTQAYT